MTELALLSVVTSIAAVLRWPFVLTGLWRDEGSSYFDIAGRSLGAAVQEIARAEISPPGYFLVLRSWLRFAGSSDIAIKFPSFCFGVAVVPATYVLARQFGSRSAAMLAALLAAGALTGVELSGIARPYTLAALLAAVTVLFAIRTARFGSYRSAVAYGLVATALAYVQYTGVIVVAAIAAVSAFQLLAAERRRGALLVLGATVCAALAYAPQWALLRHAERSRLAWLPQARADAGAGPLIEEVAHVLPLDVAHTALVLECLIPLGVLAIVFRSRLTRVDYAFLIVPVLAGAVCEAMNHLTHPRYMYPFVPLADATLAIGLVRLARFLAIAVRERRANASTFACAGVALAIAVTLGGAFAAQLKLVRSVYSDPAISGMRALARAEPSLFSQRTLVVVAPDYLGPSFVYYVRGNDGRVIGFPHRHSPQYFRYEHYDDAWNVPGVVSAAEEDIAGTFDARYDRLAIVSDSAVADRGNVRYTLASELAVSLARRYRVVGRRDFAGREEAVSITLLERRRRSEAR